MTDINNKIERLRNIRTVLELHEQNYKKSFNSFSFRLYKKLFWFKCKKSKSFYHIDENLLKRENVDCSIGNYELKKEINMIIDENIKLRDSCDYYKTIIESKSNIIFLKIVNILKSIMNKKEKENIVGNIVSNISSNTPIIYKKEIEKKPKIGLLVDVPNWAYDNIATQIKLNLRDCFDFKTVYEKDINNIADMFYLFEDCDVIYFFWRKKLYEYWENNCKKYIEGFYGSVMNHYNKYVKSKTITAGIYDHLLMDKDKIKISQSIFGDENSLVHAYSVSSKKIFDLYNNTESIKLKPSCVITDGVDLELFKPKDLGRFNNIENRTITFGWVGNSKWVVEGKSYADLKGIHTIIKPSIELLKDQGYNIELVMLDAKNGFVPHEEMPNYYSTIDCYLCASLYEGTPNPILEAMACGIPVITTDVGIVPEVLGEKQKEFILEERSCECMADMIKKILERKEYFSELSQENLISIKTWDWSFKTKLFSEFWIDLLKKRNV